MHVLFRDEKREHRRAVERRDRQQVEKEQVEIDEGEHGQEHEIEVRERLALRDERRSLTVESPGHSAGKGGHRKVRCRSGKADDDVACFGILKVRRVVRHRLRIAEHGTVHREHAQRQDDRAERVDVLERVKRQAPRALCRGIPKLVCGKPVRHLVKDDGGHEAQDRADYVDKIL